MYLAHTLTNSRCSGPARGYGKPTIDQMSLQRRQTDSTCISILQKLFIKCWYLRKYRNLRVRKHLSTMNSNTGWWALNQISKNYVHASLYRKKENVKVTLTLIFSAIYSWLDFLPKRWQMMTRYYRHSHEIQQNPVFVDPLQWVALNFSWFYSFLGPLHGPKGVSSSSSALFLK